MTDNSPSRDAALFLQLVLGLQQAAMVALGKLMTRSARSKRAREATSKRTNSACSPRC